MTAKTLNQGFKDAFIRYAQKTAICFLRNGNIETEFSYGQLNRHVSWTASAFMTKGVKKGDRVILCFEKSPAFVIAHLACQRIGSVSVPLSTGLKQTEMTYFLNDIQAALAVVGPVQKDMIHNLDPSLTTLTVDTAKRYSASLFSRTTVEEVPAATVEPRDPALIIYTSGTTGKPKGAVLTHGNLVHDAQNIINIWEITDADIVCHALPLFHIHGLCFALHTALMAGGHVLMLDSFSHETVLSVLGNRNGQNRCTIFMGVPAMYRKLLDNIGEQNRNFDHIRLWASGSAPLLENDFYRIKEILGREVVEREGMSETGMNFSNPLNGKRKPGSIGLPLPDLQVRIVQPESGKDVALGQIGEIWLKGPSITSGYWRKPKETNEVFEKDWFRTGDLGCVDEEGYYYITDRLKHIIISGGENISPKEIERVINGVEGVTESVVVGIPDEKWGEKVVAAVVKNRGYSLTTQAVINTCRKHLHNWKCPKNVVFVKEIPKNTMGKVLIDEVRKFFIS
ncbi:MAG: AMP-binding protein [Deltaproteobacteria bacterium]|nr:AMP-binding protein [Deltaproteobacteria bacterium]